MESGTNNKVRWEAVLLPAAGLDDRTVSIENIAQHRSQINLPGKYMSELITLTAARGYSRRGVV